MGRSALLALDVGTSGCRAELFTPDGRSLAHHGVDYALLTPAPGAAEQRPEDWWDAVVTCTRRVCAYAPGSVAAIGLSVQGHSWLPVDTEFRPLRPALTWLDNRAAAKAADLAADHPLSWWGEHAGKAPGPWHLLPQLLWLREHDPHCLTRARYLLFAHDYLLAKLTGAPVSDFTTAAGSLLFDLPTGEWSPGLLGEYGVAPQWLAPLQPSGASAGCLTASAAAALGLAAETLVAVGGQDQKVAALAAGLAPHTATASLGTATALMARLAAPRFEPSVGAIPCFPYLERGQYVLEAPLATTGGALRWLREVLGVEGFEPLLAEAEQAAPGSGGVTCFPHLAGAAAPHWRPAARAAFCGLSLASGRGELTRAVLEAVAYDLRANLDHMAALGCALERLVVFGGGARSDLWPQIIAAVAGLPTFAGRGSEAATRGAAWLAARALGQDPAVFALPLREIAVPHDWEETYAALYCHHAIERAWYFNRPGEY